MARPVTHRRDNAHEWFWSKGHQDWDSLPPSIQEFYLTEFQKDDAALCAADRNVRETEARLAELKDKQERRKVALKVLGYDGPEVAGVEVTWTIRAVETA